MVNHTHTHKCEKKGDANSETKKEPKEQGWKQQKNNNARVGTNYPKGNRCTKQDLANATSAGTSLKMILGQRYGAQEVPP